ncbi:SCO family protein [Streptomyces sp. 549]|uniref:SCO family protein n=1 Tax=Streptomyces sp. 549 TaxID=3049076 RepID=UPI0024C2A735|nr:SCO family protein [Streptomyces sp. 549]MDK1474978.1 SCO family protein [Streptomyces sp. 549]
MQHSSTHRTPAARRRRALAALAAAALLATGATACGSGDDGTGEREGVAEVSGTADTKQATLLDRPFDKPDLVLTDTEGKEYDFLEETKGKPTLLYFGYTNCPDVCPLTMSNIALAKAELPEADQEKLTVVFVTSDPERDTPEELGAWLKGAAPGSVGLTGDFATIQAGARTLGVAIEPSEVKDNGDVVSTHGSQVLFFSPEDDKAHVLYTEGVTAETFEADFPKLVKGENP